MRPRGSAAMRGLAAVCWALREAPEWVFWDVQAMEHMEFYEAVESLAEKYNIPLEREEGDSNAPKVNRSLKKELLEIHLYAAEYFQKAFLFR